MRLNGEAIACTLDRQWFYGYLSGFNFSLKQKIETKDYIQEPDRFKTITQWIKGLGYKKTNTLTRTLLKNILIKDFTTQHTDLHNKRGVLKVFIGKTYSNVGSDWTVEDFEDENILCANCVWTCKQGKNVEIVSCKAFKNDSFSL